MKAEFWPISTLQSFPYFCNLFVDNTVKDPLLPNTVSQEEEKPHTAGLDDTGLYRNTAR